MGPERNQGDYRNAVANGAILEHTGLCGWVENIGIGLFMPGYVGRGGVS